jgi:hypothetical protein
MTTPPTPPSVDPNTVLPFPSISVVLNDDRPRVEIAGTHHLLEGDDLDQLRENARLRMAKTAQALGRPVQATAHEPTGSWSLIVHPDGTIQAGSEVEVVKPSRRQRRLPWRRTR